MSGIKKIAHSIHCDQFSTERRFAPLEALAASLRFRKKRIEGRYKSEKERGK